MGVVVHTVGLDSWRTISQVPPRIFKGDSGQAIVNGAFHWRGTRGEHTRDCGSGTARWEARHGGEKLDTTRGGGWDNGRGGGKQVAWGMGWAREGGRGGAQVAVENVTGGKTGEARGSGERRAAAGHGAGGGTRVMGLGVVARMRLMLYKRRAQLHYLCPSSSSKPGKEKIDDFL
ncbi:hypothetical protein Scep_018577 [Stephania cephalantha]|uniref:Uncharacterized protein n=1 Tax=Stephania cephalantha TaxID=152367 RepID=A0AAP0I9B8_9MAGN